MAMTSRRAGASLRLRDGSGAASGTAALRRGIELCDFHFMWWEFEVHCVGVVRQSVETRNVLSMAQAEAPKVGFFVR